MIITKAHNGHLHASHAWPNTHGRDRIYTFYIHSTIVMWPLSVKFSKPPLKKDILISLSPDDATPPWFLQAFYYSPRGSYPVRRLHNVGIPESLDDNPIKNWTLNLSFLFGQLVIHNHCCLDEYSSYGSSIFGLLLSPWEDVQYWIVYCLEINPDCSPATIISQYWLCVQVNCPEPPHFK